MTVCHCVCFFAEDLVETQTEVFSNILVSTTMLELLRCIVFLLDRLNCSTKTQRDCGSFNIFVVLSHKKLTLVTIYL